MRPHVRPERCIVFKLLVANVALQQTAVPLLLTLPGPLLFPAFPVRLGRVQGIMVGPRRLDHNLRLSQGSERVHVGGQIRWQLLQLDVVLLNVAGRLFDLVHHEEVLLQGGDRAEAQPALQTLHTVLHSVAGNVLTELAPAGGGEAALGAHVLLVAPGNSQALDRALVAGG